MNSLLKFNKKPNLIESKFKSLFFVSIFGWIILLIGQVIDNILAGHFFGETGLAAVQLIAPFSLFISAVGSFVGMGFAVKFSYLKGEGKTLEANKNVGLGLFTTIVLGLIVALAMFFLKEPLLNLFNTSPQVREYAGVYYDWYIIIAFVQPIFLLLFKLINQDGDPLWTVMASVGQVLTNLIVSIVLVKFIGINGLSLGTLISICIGIIIVSMHFFTKKNSIKIIPSFNLKNLKDPAKFGFPAFLGNVSIAIVNVILNAFITHNFGDAYLASFTVVCFVCNLKLVFTCVSDSISAFLSTAKGANNNDDIEKCFKIIKKYCIILSIIMSIITMALALVIPFLFNVQQGSAQYVYSYMAVLIIAPVFICFAFNINIGATYTAIGKPKITLIEQLLANLLLPVIFPIIICIITKNYYGMITGTALAAVVAVAIMSIGLALLHKPHKVFICDKIEEEQFSIDVFLNDEYIPKVRKELLEKLANIDTENIYKEIIISLYDEACSGIRSKNPDKLITVRVTYSFLPDKIRIISKNNGRILSTEEKETELKNNKEKYKTINAMYEEKIMKISTMISFNYQLITINKAESLI